MKNQHPNPKINRRAGVGWLPKSFAAVLAVTFLGRLANPTASAQGVPDPNGPNVLCGKAAVTCFGGYVGGGFGGPVNPFGYVAGIVDVRDPAANGAVLDQNWAPPMYHGPSSSPWTATNLGQVFGVTLDDASPPNIYVSATTLYGPLYFGPGGPGAVYKLHRLTGAISIFAVLPNGNMSAAANLRTGPALGNICFDPVHRQFFVSNFEDGNIYRLDMAGNWLAAQAYDHGAQGRPGATPPLSVIADNGSVGAMTALGRRTWGLNVYDKRLYYGVWYQDSANAGNPPNEVWSVGLDSTGAPDASTARREFQTPSLTAGTYSSPVSDISFSDPGRMLLAERTTPFGGAHQSRHLEYNRNLSGQWVNSGKNFYTGMAGLPDSSAGGGDFDCKGDVWVTADYLKGTIYGLSHIDGGGNTLATITAASYLVDLNGVLGSQDKTQIGDVVINRSCCQCIRICDAESECLTNGNYSYTFTVTNNFSGPISHLVFLESPGVVFSPDIINLSPALNPGQGTVVTVNYSVTNAAVTNVCFRMSAHNENFFQCCVIEHCLPVPQCCVRISNDCLVCNSNGNGGWTYDFDFLNVSGSPVKYIYLVADPAIVTVSPIILGTPLPNGASTHLTVNISPPIGTNCPNRLCFIVSAHTPTFALCCAIKHCVALPSCCPPKTYTLNADFDSGTIVNLNHNPANQLQLNPTTKPLPYVAVPCSARGTIVRIDVNTGVVLGEYYSAPNNMGRNPSRTTVDQLGNVWVGNRDEYGTSPAIGGTSKGSVVRIGLLIGGTRGDKIPTGGGGFTFSPNPLGQYVQNPSYSTCVDRDGDGLIKTSRGLADILPWLNGGGVDSHGGVTTAEDECITIYTRVTGAGARHLSIDCDNNLWVGGLNDSEFEKLSGVTGAPIPLTQFSIGCGGYGGVLDGFGVLWSGSQLMRYNTTTMLGACVPGIGMYGLGLSPLNCHVVASMGYVSSNGMSGVLEFDSAGNLVNNNSVVNYGYGICVDGNGHVWVAQWNRVAHLDQNLNLIGYVTGVASGPGPINGARGVAVDSNGKIWVSEDANNRASRIDPSLNAGVGNLDLAVPLGNGANPYNYSDMTGFVGLGATCRYGFWSVCHDACAAGADWGAVSWNANVPANTSLKVEVRAADDKSTLSTQAFKQVKNAQSFCGTGILGRYLEVRVSFNGAPCSTNSPILYDLTVDCCTKASCQPTNRPPNVVKCPGPFSFPNSNGPVTLTMNLPVNDPDGDPLTVKWIEGSVLQTDNVPAGAPSPTIANLSFTHTFAPGNHVVIIEVDDGSGHKAICDVIVNVGDHNGPIIAMPPGVSVVAFSGAIPNFIGEQHIAVDDNTPPEQIVLGQAPSAGLVRNQGVQVIQITARDLAGNTSTGQTYFAVGPVVRISSPANYALFTAPATVNITAAIASNVTGVASVQLLNGSAVVGTDNTPPYSFVVSNLPAGGYILTARAMSTNNVVSTSVGVVITVTGGGTPGPLLRSAAMLGEHLCFNLQTEAGVTCHVEYTDSLFPPDWKMLQTIAGDGSMITVTNSAAFAPQRFYRVRVDQ